MRIRNYRYEDTPTLAEVQRLAARFDGLEEQDDAAFERWLTDPELDAPSNAFVMTDDDDELMTWGQAGTLEGIEGEIVGYTVVHLLRDEQGYHFVCRGTVHPQHRRRNAGRALLICALNRARILAAEFEFEAEEAGIAVYFEALLPASDPTSARLAARCEMQPVSEGSGEGLQLYRREL